MAGLRTIVLLIAITGYASSTTDFASKQAELLDRLLDSYNSYVMPQNDDSIAINCSVGLAPIRLLDVNFDKGEIEILFWMDLMWEDYRLKWDPAEASNLTKLTLPKDKVWRPDIVVYNGISELVSLSGIGDQVVVKNTGTVIYVPPVKIRAFCKDKQTQCSDKGQVHGMTCNIKLGSWVRSGLEMDLSPQAKSFVEPGDFSTMIDASLKFSTPKRNVLLYPCCPEPYPSVNFPIYVSHVHKNAE